MANKPFSTRFKNLRDASPDIKAQYVKVESLQTAEEKAYYMFNTMGFNPHQISKKLGGISVESVLGWIKANPVGA